MASAVAEAFVTLRPDASKFADETQGFFSAHKGKFALAGAGIGAAIGGGIATFKIGQSFNEAFDTIRLGTGETGAVLRGLQDDFKAVFKTAPVDAGTVAQAISDLNTRLGSTGPELQSLTRDFIDFARINKVDTSGAIRDVTRLMNSMNMETSEAPGLLDKLTRAAQISGIGVDRLTNYVIDAGPAFEELGFDLDRSIALFAQMEKVGAKPEEVLSSLNLALNQLARDGATNAEEAFAEYVQQIKDAPDILSATTIASELFGARVGSKVADDIRSGKFEVDEFMAAIAASEGTLQSAVADTDDFSQSWQRFKNNALLLVEPIATRFFGLLSEGMAWVVAHGIPVMERFAPVVAAVGTAIGQAMTVGVQVALPWLRRFADFAGEKFAEFQRYYQESIEPAIENIVRLVQWAVGEVEKRWPLIEAVVRPVLESVQNVVQTVFGVVTGILDAVIKLIGGDFSGAWNAMQDVARLAMEGVRDAVRHGLDLLRALLRLFFDLGRDLVGGLRDGAQASGRRLLGWMRDLPREIVRALGHLGSLLRDAGRAVIDGLLDGMRQAWENARNWLAGRAGDIRNLKGPIAEDRRLLIPEGEAIIDGLVAGMRRSWPRVEELLSGMTVQLPALVEAPARSSAQPVALPSSPTVQFLGPVTVTGDRESTDRWAGDLAWTLQHALRGRGYA
ncbi:MAG: phage tail tape measure protein [Phycisphaerales bacterium]|nr:MAG: phage tail tape measure protein [Phycisphaerales bacterium]